VAPQSLELRTKAFGALALTELNRSGYVNYNPPRHDSTRSN
jgi:hypothetical protein